MWTVLMASCLGTAWLVGRLFPALSTAADPKPGREPLFEGLRGLLAPAVMFHHLFLERKFLRTGVWQPPDEGLFVAVGPGAVAVFFFVTASLFWPRQRTEPVTNFYLKRILRLAPMIVVLGLVTQVLTTLPWLEPSVPWTQLAQEWLPFLSAGLVQPVMMNGAPIPLVICGILWSLKFESAFYVAFPWLHRLKLHPLGRGIVWIGIAGLLVFYHRQAPQFIQERMAWSGLALGCAMAELRPWIPKLTHWGWGFVPFLAISVGVLLGIPQDWVFMLMVPGFVVILGGNDLFGILTWAPLRLLGLVSYSFYLLHGAVIQSLMAWNPSSGHFTDLQLVGTGVAIGAISTIVSCGTYWFVERPFLNLATRVSNAPWNLFLAFRLKSTSLQDDAR